MHGFALVKVKWPCQQYVGHVEPSPNQREKDAKNDTEQKLQPWYLLHLSQEPSCKRQVLAGGGIVLPKRSY